MTPFFSPSDGSDGESKDNQLTKDKRGAERIGPCPGSKRDAWSSPERLGPDRVKGRSMVFHLWICFRRLCFAFALFQLHVRLSRQKNRSCTGSAAGFLCFASARGICGCNGWEELHLLVRAGIVKCRLWKRKVLFSAFLRKCSPKTKPKTQSVNKIQNRGSNFLKLIYKLTSQRDPDPCALDPEFAPLSRRFRSSIKSPSSWSPSQTTDFVALQLKSVNLI